MYNYIIIGGGIVGLATAYALKRVEKESSILVLEKEDSPAKHQTGRNSGVIHSGVYYPPGSLKAELATNGSRRLIEFCKEQGIRHEICGKIIVATNKRELEYLNILEKRGKENGLNVRIIDSNEMRDKEPYVDGLAALYVPEAGIVSYREVAEKLVEILQDSGVHVLFGKKVTEIYSDSENSRVSTAGEEYVCEYLINCGGLHSDIIASKSGVSLQHRIIPFRGEYYELVPDKRYLVKNLIYPVPDPSFPFLGVHFTRMIDGSIHAGPNAVLSLKREGYNKFSFDAGDTWSTITYGGFWKLVANHWKDGFHELYRSLSKSEFVRSLQKLIPDISSEDLVPSAAGVRAQALNPDGSLVQDFLIKQDGSTIHICNAPSPAATSSLEIGNMIYDDVINKKTKREIAT